MVIVEIPKETIQDFKEAGFFKILQSKKKVSCLVEMDADFSHSPSELKKNISYFFTNSLDLLICSRYIKGSEIINWSLSRSKR